MIRLLFIFLFITASAYAHNFGDDGDLSIARDLYVPRFSALWSSVAAHGKERTGDTGPEAPTLAYPIYISGATYSVNAYVAGSDMNIYRSLGSTTGNDPIIDRGKNWELAILNADTTLNVPSRFTTFEAAWMFLQNAVIGQGHLVTIKFGDGTYDFGAKRFVINHPQGSQISIIGNTTTPANVILNFTGPAIAFKGYIQDNWAFWAISAGHHIGLIDGFTINGPGMAASNAYGAVAISAFEASSVTVGPHVMINNAYSGVAAFFNSTIWADGITVRGGGDGNIWAYAGSTISCHGCTSTDASTFYSRSGALADNFSYLFAPSLKTSGNACGVSLFSGSSAKLDSAVLAEGLCFTGMNTTEGYGGNLGPTQNGIVEDSQDWHWNNLLNKSNGGYKPFDLTWTGSSAVGGVGTINNSGNDIHCFLGGSAQTVRTVFGLAGNIADCSTRGASQFAIFTYDAKPVKFGTNNRQGFQIDQNNQTVYTVLGKKWGGTHGSNATLGVATLSGGTATVSTTAIAAMAAPGGPGDAIYLTLQNCLSCGSLSVGKVVAGTSFIINSTNPLDASNVLWEIKHIY